MSSTTHSNAPSRSAGVVMILLTLAGWTSIPLFLRHFATGEHPIDPWTANGWRYGVSALLWAPVLVHGFWRSSLPAGLWRAALVPSLFNIVAQVAFAIAPYMVEPGLMTFSMRLQIIFLTIGAALLFQAERRVIRTAGFLGGMVMVMAGTAATLLMQPGGLGSGTAGGIAVSITAGLFYAAYGLSVRKWMQGFHPFTAFAAVSQYTAAAILALMLLLGDDAGATAWRLPPWEFFLLMLSAIIGIGLGHTLYFASIARLGLAVSAGVVQLQPVTVSIGSYFLFQERLNAAQWCGGAVAIAGAVVMLRAQHAAAPTTEAGPVKAPDPPSDVRAQAARPAQPHAGEELDDAAVLCGYCGLDLTAIAGSSPCPSCGREHCDHASGRATPGGMP
ncbi:MAG: EamA family transporter [Phycisphaeraceae bacterium]|nr:EamA family transporter [Phycisphaerae bacterium]MBX3392528.1 EamA family transporter [Phycisphaeraceae bacterium]